MREFYEHFYQALAQSKAYARFCERAYGRNLGQHGFADLQQLEALIAVTGLGTQDHALDLGCGNGCIAEYIAERTGAEVTGLDYIPEAIHQAQERTVTKRDRLTFMVGDINALALPRHEYDVIFSIDTIYFSNDYTATIKQLIAALRPRGQLAFLYSYGREPWVPVEAFPAEMLPPDKTPLAVALQANALTFTTQDFTTADYHLAQLRKQVLNELKPAFAAEGNLFLYESRMGDADGVRQALELGLHRRYLYHTRLDA